MLRTLEDRALHAYVSQSQRDLAEHEIPTDASEPSSMFVQSERAFSPNPPPGDAFEMKARIICREKKELKSGHSKIEPNFGGWEGGLSSLSNRKEGRKWSEHKPEGTRGFPRLEVFEKDAMKKDDRNHPNSMQHGNITTLKIGR